METKKEERIQLQAINVKHATVTIIGDGDLVLNKMNDVTGRNHYINSLVQWKTYRFLRKRPY